MVERAADHRAAVEKHGDTLTFDFAGSSPPCAGPMNSVLATTLSSVYLAMRHIFPDVPISAGAFEPLIVKRPEGTFLDAQLSAPGLGLRGRGLAAHRRGRVRGHGAGAAATR